MNKSKIVLITGSTKGIGKATSNKIPRKDATSTVGQSLINMAKEAKNHSYQAPPDIIKNLNKYLYTRT